MNIEDFYIDKIDNRQNIIRTEGDYVYRNLHGILVKEKIKEYKCILIDDNGTLYSNNHFNYKRLSALLERGIAKDYIEDGDFIILRTHNGHVHKLIANVDPYYGKGIDYHHIDFISEDLIPNSHGWTLRTKEINKETEISPYLHSKNILKHLQHYFENNLPIELRKHIIPKQCRIPVIDDKEKTRVMNLPKLWLLYEREIYGKNRRAD